MKNKLPIFICSSEPQIIKIIDDLISQDKLDLGVDIKSSESVELVVINPEIQQRLEHQYGLMKIDEEQRKQVIAAQSNEQEKKRAKETAITIQDILTKAFYGDKSELKVDNFNMTELKNAITAVKHKSISNKDVGGLINFISLHNFIAPIDLETKFHLRRWKLTFSASDMLSSTTDLMSEVLSKIEIMKGQYELLSQNADKYRDEIVVSNPIELTANADIKKTRSKKKSKECCVDGQCVCGEPKVTETEQLLKEEQNNSSSNDTKRKSRSKST